MAKPIIPSPFSYPENPHRRRHGPAGWRDYKRYRPWLRDDFAFRCVFCLLREKWIEMRRAFPVDHFKPRSLRPDLAHDYNNLLYLCANCNGVKSDSFVPNPCKVALAECLAVSKSGKIKALNKKGQRLVDELALDNESLTEFRRLIIGTLLGLLRHDWARFVDWMGFPVNLPNLTRHKPPRNNRAKGVSESWFARRARGELPEVY